jgi:hypothetical protein
LNEHGDFVVSMNSGAMPPQELEAAETSARVRPAELCGRLESFLGQIRPLLPQAEHLAQPAIPLLRLESLIAEIQPKLRQAYESGALVNVWAIAGLRRNELRNATVLAWLIDPRGTHGLGAKFAHSLLEQARGAPSWLVSLPDLRDISVHTEECPLGSTDSRVDISISGSDFVIFIEVKIDAPEGDRQLQRYLLEAALKASSLGKRNWAVIFLTRAGQRSSVDGVAILSWRDARRALSRIARALDEGDIRKGILSQLVDHITGF